MMQYDAVVTVALLTLAVLFVRGPWRTVCTDYARQIAFEHRDAIFDMAADGKLDFASTEYRDIRLSIERNIRFAHELTLGRFMFFSHILMRDKRVTPLSRALESITDSEVRREVSQHVEEVQKAIIQMMVFKSPLFMVLGLLFAVVSLISTSALALRRKIVAEWSETVQAEADLQPVPVYQRRT